MEGFLSQNLSTNTIIKSYLNLKILNTKIWQRKLFFLFSPFCKAEHHPLSEPNALAVIVQFHRGKHGRRARLARKWKRGVEKSLRQKSKKLCNHFNWGRDHPASALQPDGTCKGRHACDAWVSNKGKEGKCLNSAGTPGHGRHNCDNPNRCDGPAGQ